MGEWKMGEMGMKGTVGTAIPVGQGVEVGSGVGSQPGGKCVGSGKCVIPGSGVGFCSWMGETGELNAITPLPRYRAIKPATINNATVRFMSLVPF